MNENTRSEWLRDVLKAVQNGYVLTVTERILCMKRGYITHNYFTDESTLTELGKQTLDELDKEQS